MVFMHVFGWRAWRFKIEIYTDRIINLVKSASLLRAVIDKLRCCVPFALRDELDITYRRTVDSEIEKFLFLAYMNAYMHVTYNWPCVTFGIRTNCFLSMRIRSENGTKEAGSNTACYCWFFWILNSMSKWVSCLPNTKSLRQSLPQMVNIERLLERYLLDSLSLFFF